MTPSPAARPACVRPLPGVPLTPRSSLQCALLVSSLKNQARKELQSAAPAKEKPKALRQRRQPERLRPAKPAARAVPGTV